jgi:hypothetical protein
VRRQSGPLTLLLFLCAPVACNPFLAQRGEEGQACFDDGSCAGDLICEADTCWSMPDCNLPETFDCTRAGAVFQGPDGDGDGSGLCCDCDDGDPARHPGAQEICDGIDNDCDPETDETALCPQCQDGDDDGYGDQCPAGPDCDDADPDVHPGQAEVCDGRDQDCDGQTDEGLSPSPCPLQEGVCAKAEPVCLGAAGWSTCDYGTDYDAGPETDCDGLDNDCDGDTDEDADRDVLEIGPLASDGVDNNCNGQVDEPGGAMVRHPLLPGVWVDAYEMTVFDSADCTGTRYGAATDDYPAGWPVSDAADTTLYACSLPGLIPSGHLSWYRASRACAAQGKRLCTNMEYTGACDAGQSKTFPYGMAFVAGICNDPFGGAGQVEASGTRQQCSAGNATYDMSGNLMEWLQNQSNGDPATRVTVGFGYAGILCDESDDACVPYTEVSDGEDRIVEYLRCGRADDRTSRFYPDSALPWLGARCCWDEP